MDDINILLNEFSEMTDKIIIELQNEEYDQVNLSLDRRKELIGKIKKINYTKDEFKRISLSLNLSEKEKNLNKALEYRLKEKKNELRKISVIKHINSKYKKSYSVESIFINKKI